MSDIAFLNAAVSIDGAFSLICSATSLPCGSASVEVRCVDLAPIAEPAAPMRNAITRQAARRCEKGFMSIFLIHFVWGELVEKPFVAACSTITLNKALASAWQAT